MNLAVGTICKIDHISSLSMHSWQKYSRKFRWLICPCHFKSTERIVITDNLSDTLVMVQSTDNPSRLSVIAKTDIKRLGQPFSRHQDGASQPQDKPL